MIVTAVSKARVGPRLYEADEIAVETWFETVFHVPVVAFASAFSPVNTISTIKASISPYSMVVAPSIARSRRANLCILDMDRPRGNL